MAEQTWRDTEKVEVSPLDVHRVRVLEVTRSNIPSQCFRKKLNLMSELLQNFDKGGSKETLHSLKVKPFRRRVKTKNQVTGETVKKLIESTQFSDLASKIKSIKFKKADTDFNVTHAVSTMSCYDKAPREPQLDLSDSNSMDSRPDVTNKMENVSIECDTLCYGSNSIGNSVPCMQLVEKTLSLGVSDNRLTNEQELIPAFSRSHREYCTNMLNQQLNGSLERFVKELSRLQKNLYNRDNVKGRSKRRYYAGFKETEKRLPINKIKLIIIAPDLDTNRNNGELDNLVRRFIDCCKRHEMPTIFGLSRRKLGYLTHGKGFVSCIGVANYEALEDKLEDALKKVLEARNEFKLLSGRPEAMVHEKTVLKDDLLLSERVKVLLKTLGKS